MSRKHSTPMRSTMQTDSGTGDSHDRIPRGRTGAYPGNGSSLQIDGQKCTGCGACLEVCPHRVLARESASPGAKIQVIRPLNCMECGACALNCPFRAIKVKAGVGCVAAIVQGWIKGTEPSCDCGSDEQKGSGCC